MQALGLWLPLMLAAALVGDLWPVQTHTQPPARVVDGAYRGYVAVRLLGNGQSEVVEELNADRLFTPASVLKIVTVATALEHLGPEYRWLTRLTSSGAIAGGVLDGDLIIEPGADPTWGDDFGDDGATQPLAALARQISARGLTRISGEQRFR